MTGINHLDAQRVLAFAAAHPELPGLSQITHEAVGFTSWAPHTLYLAEPCRVASAVAWHDALARVRSVTLSDRPSGLHALLDGVLPTGPRVAVLARAHAGERGHLLRAAGMLPGQRRVRVGVEALREVAAAGLDGEVA